MPDCPADVRLGIGYCLAKLGRLDKARLELNNFQGFQKSLFVKNKISFSFSLNILFIHLHYLYYVLHLFIFFHLFH